MSPDRPRRSTEQLQGAYEETLHALRRRYEQLESAVAAFQPDLDEQALSVAWHSDDPLERNRADAVLSSFEKTYMLLMDLLTLSAKLARRREVIEGEESSSPVKALRNVGVLSEPAEQALAMQREVRNASQHIYVELTMSALREAVIRQLQTTPRTVTAITAWIDSFDKDPNEQPASDR